MTFLKNSWYMAMWSEELDDGLVAKRIIDRPLVFYRTDKGAVAALADVCPHRFVPLHMGKRVGADRIQCAYHGLEFNGAGNCVHNPHGKERIPPAAKVRAYSTTERHGIVWVWMGEAPADHSLVPDLSILDDSDPLQVSQRDWLRMDSNYLLITENLLDLSHASFLHEGLLGNEDTIKADLKVESTDKGFVVRRSMPDIRIHALGDMLFHGDGRRVDSWADISWQAPGCLLNNSGVTDIGAPRSEGTGMLGIHIMTPETETSTLYYFVSIRQNPLPATEEEKAELRIKLGELRRMAFGEQDRPVLEAQQLSMSDPAVDISRPALFEIDAGAAELHRRLNALLADEAEAS